MRRMKQFKAAKRATTAPSVSALERGLERRAKVRSCPYCGEKFDNTAKIKSHLERSGCLKRAEAKAARVAKAKKAHARYDPLHPERGKVGKGTLLAKMLADLDSE